MIIYFFITFIFSKKGYIIPEKDESLHLTILPDSSVRFLDKRRASKVEKADLVQYNEKKKKIILKDRDLCKVNEVSSPIVSTCQDTYSFVKFTKFSEAGMFKFKTDLNNCLTLGSYDEKTEGYFVHATKCKPNESYQRFKFVNLDSDDLVKEKSDSENELGKLIQLLNLDDNREITIIIKGEPDNFVFKTTVKEFNDLLPLNSRKRLLNHDIIVEKDLSLLGNKNEY